MIIREDLDHRDRKHLDGGVGEARVMFGPGYRLSFGKQGNVLVLRLIGGDKASQRKAAGYWKDYKEREDGKAK